MIQEGQKALVKGAVWREKDNDREAARSEEMILLWGVVPPLLSNGGGVDGWMDGWLVSGGMDSGWWMEGWWSESQAVPFLCLLSVP